jgi:two-component sensor histidine kinase
MSTPARTPNPRARFRNPFRHREANTPREGEAPRDGEAPAEPNSVPAEPSSVPDATQLAQELERRTVALRDAEQLIESLRSEVEERRAEADALRRVGEATGAVLDLEDMLKVTVDVALNVTGTDSCQIYLLDRRTHELVLRAADATGDAMIGKIRLRVGEGITGAAAQERKPVAVSRNATEDRRFKYFPQILEEQYQSILSVPLLSRSRLIGVVNVRTREPREYSKHQMRLLSGIAGQVAGAIEKARLTRRLERTAVQLQHLSEVSQAIMSNVYLDDMLSMFVEMTARAMSYRICTVMLVDHQTQELVIKATSGPDGRAPIEEYTSKPPPKLGESIAGRVAREGRVMTVADVKKHPHCRFPDIAERAGLTSLASVPLMCKGEVLGVLNCYTELVHEFPKEELAILQALGSQAALAIQTARLMLKSAVIQEMHHRVKNNLQQIAGLVRLQMRFSGYATVEEAMTDTLNRIQAIAAVHELLLRDDLDSVSINRLADQILIATKQSVVAPGKALITEVVGPEVRLPLSHATTFALVLNELVQNAVEHGFRDVSSGHLSVRTDRTDSDIVVTVTNDGNPLPEGFDPEQTGRLGLRIVNDLVHGGLNGEFRMVSNNGIAASVRFPIP